MFLFIYLCLERGGRAGGEGEKHRCEKNIHQLLLVPATQA